MRDENISQIFSVSGSVVRLQWPRFYCCLAGYCGESSLPRFFEALLYAIYCIRNLPVLPSGEFNVHLVQYTYKYYCRLCFLKMAPKSKV